MGTGTKLETVLRFNRGKRRATNGREKRGRREQEETTARACGGGWVHEASVRRDQRGAYQRPGGGAPSEKRAPARPACHGVLRGGSIGVRGAGAALAAEQAG